MALAASGSISAGLQLFTMPYLLRRFDHARMYNVCMAIFPYVYLLLPLLNLVARTGIEEVNGVETITAGTKALLWLGIGIILSLARIACLAFS